MGEVSPITLYWRPGCLFCVRLRRGLRRASIPLTEVNIWEDRAGGLTVRSLTGGTETVPTVTVAGVALVNPTVRRVLSEIRLRAPELFPDLDVSRKRLLGSNGILARALARRGFARREDR